MKICTKCKLRKNETEFYRKGKSKRTNSFCKKCFNKYCSDRWVQKKLEAIEYLGGCCSICGYKKHYGALEFHHKDPTIKKFQWDKARKLKKETIKKELDKCILVCANCHREIHEMERSTTAVQSAVNFHVTGSNPVGGA